MIRISVTYFYGLGSAVQDARHILVRPFQSSPPAALKLSDVWVALKNVENELNNLFSTEWILPAVRSAFHPGQLLIINLKVITDRTDWDSEVYPHELWAISNSLTEFETVLRSELNIADCYFVTRKGGYDTGELIAHAESIFPNELINKVPQAIPDIRESGKCLAFEMHTAAGFHILRATESVLRKYWTIVSKNQQHPKQRNIGVYLDRLKKKGFGSDKVIATLQQIKDLHRNPLMHPEVILNLDEAIDLFGICRSATSQMLKEIPLPLIAVPTNT